MGAMVVILALVALAVSVCALIGARRNALRAEAAAARAEAVERRELKERHGQGS